MENTTTLQPSLVVKQALKNAELLVDYLAQNGIEFDFNDVKIITNAKYMIENNKWDIDIENHFWISYKNLTEKVKPNELESILAMREIYIENPTFLDKIFRNKYRKNQASKTVTFYTVLAVFSMIIILFLHMYYSIGTIRLSRVQAINNKITNTYNYLSEIKSVSDFTKTSTTEKITKLMEEISYYDAEKKSNIIMLANWIWEIKIILGFFDYHDYNNIRKVIESQANLPPEESIRLNIEVIQRAQNYIFLLGLYILPLFYGFLGAITFVLRDLSIKIQKKTFRKENNITHIIRLILGVIAGLAVGVFWGDITQRENFSVISSLGPLLVAFLAGLTVEYVFSAIEKWIISFLEKPPVSKQ